MKVLILNCILMLAFLSLIGCSQNQKSVDLQVSASFTVGAAGFTGGLIAYGEGPNGAKFSVSSGTGQSINTTIVDGTWKIYVMGWEGDGTGNKFVGPKQCGMSEVNLASNDTSVNITLAETNCAGTTFATDTAPMALLISSCGGLYKYVPGTNSFGAISSDGFCATLPTSLQTSFEYYRLTLPTIQGPNVSAGIASECINAKYDSGIRLTVPTQKFPFRVLMYRSLQDCKNPTSPRQSAFGFLNGLAAGNQASFDHHYAATTTTEARLFLPTSMTRRGYSPFIDILPRILCGTVDCFTKPVLPTVSGSPGGPGIQFNVPWSMEIFDSGNNSNKTIIKGFKPTNVSSNSCDTPTLNLLSQSPYFSPKECSIENGDLRGNFARNAFTCHSGSANFTYAVDLYERGGKIYVVNHDTSGTPKTWVDVYSERGILERKVNILSSSDTYRSMAVDTSGNIYVISTISTVTYLSKYTTNGTASSWNSSGYSDLSGVQHIELSDSGTILTATSTIVRAFATSGVTLSTLASYTILGTSPVIKKILFRNSYLYTLSNDGSASNLDSVTYSSGTLSSSSTRNMTMVNHTTFHYSEIGTNKYFIFDNASGLETQSLTSTTPITQVTSSNPHSLIMVKNMVYRLNGTSVLTFSAKSFNPATPSMGAVQNANTGVCADQFTITGTTTNPSYNLSFRSQAADSVNIIFDEAFRYLGRRDVDTNNSFYYFQSLAESEKDNEQNAGGILGHVEQMLGPDGLGGVLNGIYPGKTCAQIRDDIVPATGSVTQSATLYDIIDGSTQTVSITLSKAQTNMMGTLACGGTNCYPDLLVDVGMVGKSEKMRLKLDCEARRGSMESMEYKVSDSENHHFVLWNTDTSTMNYEEYRLEDRTDNASLKTNATITRLVKTVLSGPHDYVEMRRLEINRDSGGVEGRANEFYRQYSSTLTADILMTTALNTGKVASNFTNTNSSVSYGAGTPQIGQIVGSDSIKSLGTTFSILNSAGSCMLVTNQNPTILTSSTPCSIPTQTISAPSLANTITSLEDLNTESDNAGGTMDSSFAAIFELNP